MGAITDRNLAVGTKLVAPYKGKDYHATVVGVAGEKPGIAFKLDDGPEPGKQFSSPSSAGSFIRGGKATNGWAFWRLVDSTEEPPTETPPTDPGDDEVERADPGTSTDPAEDPDEDEEGAGEKAPAEKEPATVATRTRAPRATGRAPKAGKATAGKATAGSYECGECGERFPTPEAVTAHFDAEHAAATVAA